MGKSSMMPSFREYTISIKSEIQNKTIDNLNNLSNTIDDINIASENLDKNTSKSLNELSETVSTMQESITKGFDKINEELGDGLNLEKTQKGIEDLTVLVTNLQSQLTAITENKGLSAIGERFETLSKNITDAVESIGVMKAALDHGIDISSPEAIENSFAMVSTYMDKTRNDVKNKISELNTLLKGVGLSMSDINTLSDKTVSAAFNGKTASLEKAHKLIGEISSYVQGIQKQHSKSVSNNILAELFGDSQIPDMGISVKQFGKVNTQIGIQYKKLHEQVEETQEIINKDKDLKVRFDVGLNGNINQIVDDLVSKINTIIEQVEEDISYIEIQALPNDHTKEWLINDINETIEDAKKEINAVEVKVNTDKKLTASAEIDTKELQNILTQLSTTLSNSSAFNINDSGVLNKLNDIYNLLLSWKGGVPTVITASSSNLPNNPPGGGNGGSSGGGSNPPTPPKKTRTVADILEDNIQVKDENESLRSLRQQLLSHLKMGQSKLTELITNQTGVMLELEEMYDQKIQAVQDLYKSVGTAGRKKFGRNWTKSASFDQIKDIYLQELKKSEYYNASDVRGDGTDTRIAKYGSEVIGQLPPEISEWQKFLVNLVESAKDISDLQKAFGKTKIQDINKAKTRNRKDLELNFVHVEDANNEKGYKYNSKATSTINKDNKNGRHLDYISGAASSAQDWYTKRLEEAEYIVSNTEDELRNSQKAIDELVKQKKLIEEIQELQATNPKDPRIKDLKEELSLLTSICLNQEKYDKAFLDYNNLVAKYKNNGTITSKEKDTLISARKDMDSSVRHLDTTRIINEKGETEIDKYIREMSDDSNTGRSQIENVINTLLAAQDQIKDQGIKDIENLVTPGNGTFRSLLKNADGTAIRKSGEVGFAIQSVYNEYAEVFSKGLIKSVQSYYDSKEETAELQDRLRTVSKLIDNTSYGKDRYQYMTSAEKNLYVALSNKIMANSAREQLFEIINKPENLIDDNTGLSVKETANKRIKAKRYRTIDDEGNYELPTRRHFNVSSSANNIYNEFISEYEKAYKKGLEEFKESKRALGLDFLSDNSLASGYKFNLEDYFKKLPEEQQKLIRSALTEIGKSFEDALPYQEIEKIINYTQKDLMEVRKNIESVNDSKVGAKNNIFTRLNNLKISASNEDVDELINALTGGERTDKAKTLLDTISKNKSLSNYVNKNVEAYKNADIELAKLKKDEAEYVEELKKANDQHKLAEQRIEKIVEYDEADAFADLQTRIAQTTATRAKYLKENNYTSKLLPDGSIKYDFGDKKINGRLVQDLFDENERRRINNITSLDKLKFSSDRATLYDPELTGTNSSLAGITRLHKELVDTMAEEFSLSSKETKQLYEMRSLTKELVENRQLIIKGDDGTDKILDFNLNNNRDNEVSKRRVGLGNELIKQLGVYNRSSDYALKKNEMSKILEQRFKIVNKMKNLTFSDGSQLSDEELAALMNNKGFTGTKNYRDITASKRSKKSSVQIETGNPKAKFQTNNEGQIRLTADFEIEDGVNLINELNENTIALTNLRKTMSFTEADWLETSIKADYQKDNLSSYINSMRENLGDNENYDYEKLGAEFKELLQLDQDIISINAQNKAHQNEMNQLTKGNEQTIKGHKVKTVNLDNYLDQFQKVMETVYKVANVPKENRDYSHETLINFARSYIDAKKNGNLDSVAFNNGNISVSWNKIISTLTGYNLGANGELDKSKPYINTISTEPKTYSDIIKILNDLDYHLTENEEQKIYAMDLDTLLSDYRNGAEWSKEIMGRRIDFNDVKERTAKKSSNIDYSAWENLNRYASAISSGSILNELAEELMQLDKDIPKLDSAIAKATIKYGAKSKEVATLRNERADKATRRRELETLGSVELKGDYNKVNEKRTRANEIITNWNNTLGEEKTRQLLMNVQMKDVKNKVGTRVGNTSLYSRLTGQKYDKTAVTDKILKEYAQENNLSEEQIANLRTIIEENEKVYEYKKKINQEIEKENSSKTPELYSIDTANQNLDYQLQNLNGDENLVSGKYKDLFMKIKESLSNSNKSYTDADVIDALKDYIKPFIQENNEIELNALNTLFQKLANGNIHVGSLININEIRKQVKAANPDTFIGADEFGDISGIIKKINKDAPDFTEFVKKYVTENNSLGGGTQDTVTYMKKILSDYFYEAGVSEGGENLVKEVISEWSKKRSAIKQPIYADNKDTTELGAVDNNASIYADTEMQVLMNEFFDILEEKADIESKKENIENTKNKIKGKSATDLQGMVKKGLLSKSIFERQPVDTTNNKELESFLEVSDEQVYKATQALINSAEGITQERISEMVTEVEDIMNQASLQAAYGDNTSALSRDYIAYLNTLGQTFDNNIFDYNEDLIKKEAAMLGMEWEQWIELRAKLFEEDDNFDINEYIYKYSDNFLTKRHDFLVKSAKDKDSQNYLMAQDLANVAGVKNFPGADENRMRNWSKKYDQSKTDNKKIKNTIARENFIASYITSHGISATTAESLENAINYDLTLLQNIHKIAETAYSELPEEEGLNLAAQKLGLSDYNDAIIVNNTLVDLSESLMYNTDEEQTVLEDIIASRYKLSALDQDIENGNHTTDELIDLIIKRNNENEKYINSKRKAFNLGLSTASGYYINERGYQTNLPFADEIPSENNRSENPSGNLFIKYHDNPGDSTKWIKEKDNTSEEAIKRRQNRLDRKAITKGIDVTNISDQSIYDTVAAKLVKDLKDSNKNINSSIFKVIEKRLKELYNTKEPADSSEINVVLNSLSKSINGNELDQLGINVKDAIGIFSNSENGIEEFNKTISELVLNLSKSKKNKDIDASIFKILENSLKNIDITDLNAINDVDKIINSFRKSISKDSLSNIATELGKLSTDSKNFENPLTAYDNKVRELVKKYREQRNTTNLTTEPLQKELEDFVETLPKRDTEVESFSKKSIDIITDYLKNQVSTVGVKTSEMDKFDEELEKVIKELITIENGKQKITTSDAVKKLQKFVDTKLEHYQIENRVNPEESALYDSFMTRNFNVEAEESRNLRNSLYPTKKDSDEPNPEYQKKIRKWKYAKLTQEEADIVYQYDAIKEEIEYINEKIIKESNKAKEEITKVREELDDETLTQEQIQEKNNQINTLNNKVLSKEDEARYTARIEELENSKTDLAYQAGGKKNLRIDMINDQIVSSISQEELENSEPESYLTNTYAIDDASPSWAKAIYDVLKNILNRLMEIQSNGIISSSPIADVLANGIKTDDNPKSEVTRINTNTTQEATYDPEELESRIKEIDNKLNKDEDYEVEEFEKLFAEKIQLQNRLSKIKSSETIPENPNPPSNPPKNPPKSSTEYNSYMAGHSYTPVDHSNEYNWDELINLSGNPSDTTEQNVIRTIDVEKAGIEELREEYKKLDELRKKYPNNKELENYYQKVLNKGTELKNASEKPQTQSETDALKKETEQQEELNKAKEAEPIKPQTSDSVLSQEEINNLSTSSSTDTNSKTNKLLENSANATSKLETLKSELINLIQNADGKDITIKTNGNYQTDEIIRALGEALQEDAKKNQGGYFIGSSGGGTDSNGKRNDEIELSPHGVVNATTEHLNAVLDSFVSNLTETAIEDLEKGAISISTSSDYGYYAKSGTKIDNKSDEGRVVVYNLNNNSKSISEKQLIENAKQNPISDKSEISSGTTSCVNDNHLLEWETRVNKAYEKIPDIFKGDSVFRGEYAVDNHRYTNNHSVSGGSIEEDLIDWGLDEVLKDIQESLDYSKEQLQRDISKFVEEIRIILSNVDDKDASYSYNDAKNDIVDLRATIGKYFMTGNYSFPSEAQYSNESFKSDLLDLLSKVNSMIPETEIATKDILSSFISLQNKTNISSSSTEVEQFAKISEDTISILSDQGKSEEEVLSRIREEIKAKQQLNELNEEYLVLTDKVGNVVATHKGITSNVNSSFTDKQLKQAQGGKLTHVHPAKASFFGGKDLTHMLQDEMYSGIKQIDLMWGDSTLSLDKSTLTKESQSIILNIMRNVRSELIKIYGDNANGTPSQEAREHINAIEKEIFKAISEKLNISVAENGQQAQDVTNALSDIDKAIIQRFKSIESNAIQDVNPSELINKTNISSSTPSQTPAIEQNNEVAETAAEATTQIEKLHEEESQTPTPVNTETEHLEQVGETAANATTQVEKLHDEESDEPYYSGEEAESWAEHMGRKFQDYGYSNVDNNRLANSIETLCKILDHTDPNYDTSSIEYQIKELIGLLYESSTIRNIPTYLDEEYYYPRFFNDNSKKKYDQEIDTILKRRSAGTEYTLDSKTGEILSKDYRNLLTEPSGQMVIEGFETETNQEKELFEAVEQTNDAIEGQITLEEYLKSQQTSAEQQQNEVIEEQIQYYTKLADAKKELIRLGATEEQADTLISQNKANFKVGNSNRYKFSQKDLEGLYGSLNSPTAPSPTQPDKTPISSKEFSNKFTAYARQNRITFSDLNDTDKTTFTSERKRLEQEVTSGNKEIDDAFAELKTLFDSFTKVKKETKTFNAANVDEKTKDFLDNLNENQHPTIIDNSKSNKNKEGYSDEDTVAKVIKDGPKYEDRETENISENLTDRLYNYLTEKYSEELSVLVNNDDIDGLSSLIKDEISNYPMTGKQKNIAETDEFSSNLIRLLQEELGITEDIAKVNTTINTQKKETVELTKAEEKTLESNLKDKLAEKGITNKYSRSNKPENLGKNLSFLSNLVGNAPLLGKWIGKTDVDTDALTSVMQKSISKMKESGEYANLGFAEGLDSATATDKATEEFCNSIVDDVRNYLGIHSPSTVFEKLGYWCDRGFCEGITENADDIHKTIVTALKSASLTKSDVESFLKENASIIDPQNNIYKILRSSLDNDELKLNKDKSSVRNAKSTYTNNLLTDLTISDNAVKSAAILGTNDTDYQYAKFIASKNEFIDVKTVIKNLNDVLKDAGADPKVKQNAKKLGVSLGYLISDGMLISPGQFNAIGTQKDNAMTEEAIAKKKRQIIKENLLFDADNNIVPDMQNLFKDSDNKSITNTIDQWASKAGKGVVKALLDINTSALDEQSQKVVSKAQNDLREILSNRADLDQVSNLDEKVEHIKNVLKEASGYDILSKINTSSVENFLTKNKDGSINIGASINDFEEKRNLIRDDKGGLKSAGILLGNNLPILESFLKDVEAKLTELINGRDTQLNDLDSVYKFLETKLANTGINVREEFKDAGVNTYDVSDTNGNTVKKVKSRAFNFAGRQFNVTSDGEGNYSINTEEQLKKLQEDGLRTMQQVVAEQIKLDQLKADEKTNNEASLKQQKEKVAQAVQLLNHYRELAKVLDVINPDIDHVSRFNSYIESSPSLEYEKAKATAKEEENKGNVNNSVTTSKFSRLTKEAKEYYDLLEEQYAAEQAGAQELAKFHNSEHARRLENLEAELKKIDEVSSADYSGNEASINRVKAAENIFKNQMGIEGFNEYLVASDKSLDKMISDLEKLGTQDKWSDDMKKKFASMVEQIEQVRAEIANMDYTDVYGNFDLKARNQALSKISGITQQYNTLRTQAANYTQATGFVKQMEDIAEYMNKNTKMTWQQKKAFEALYEEAKKYANATDATKGNLD